MGTRNRIRNITGLSLAALGLMAVGLTAPAAALGQGRVHRGAMERQGKAWVERTESGAPIKDGTRLILRADAGSVRVEPGASGRMTCKVLLRAFTPNRSEARRLFSAFRLNIRALPGGGALISGVSPAGVRKSFSAEYRITAPADLSLDVETGIGSISVRGPVQGEVRAITAGGDVNIGDASGLVKVETAGGNVTLGNTGNAVEARTAGGKILIGNVKGDVSLETNGGGIVTGLIGGKVRAKTAGGDIALGGAGGSILAETSGGQIQIGNAGGSVRAQTAGGSVRIRDARGRVRVAAAGGSIDLYQLRGPVRAETHGGSIVAQIDSNGKTFAPSSLKTSTGDVRVYLPQNLSITIDAAIEDATGHRIVSDFPLEIQGGQKDMLQTTVRGHGALNGGGELLRIRSVDGNIEILKLNQKAIEQLKAQQAAYWKSSAQPEP